MSAMVKVSVIIPVYNVAPYLGECLDSVLQQSLKDIEIVCVDDCSTDNSSFLLKNMLNQIFESDYFTMKETEIYPLPVIGD